MPAKAFSAPGPYCMAKTPAGFPFMTRAQPSAMWTPTRSWRQMTGRSPPATAASMIGVVGKQNSVLTPSRFRISVIASMTSIGVAPLGLALDAKPSLAPERCASARPALFVIPAKAGTHSSHGSRLSPGRQRGDTARRSQRGYPHEDRAHRELYLWHQEREGSLVLPGRDRGRDLWLGRGVCDGREG